MAAALPLAEKAVRLAAGNANYRNTLGVAYYRAGRYREAVEVLRPNLERQEDRYLALRSLLPGHEPPPPGRDRAGPRLLRLGGPLGPDATRASTAAQLEELTAFRAEAEELLGIDRKKD